MMMAACCQDLLAVKVEEEAKIRVVQLGVFGTFHA
jgi:hypothetical protein